MSMGSSGSGSGSWPVLINRLVKQELTDRRKRRYSIVDEYGGDYVNVNMHFFHINNSLHFARGSIAAGKIDAFFGKEISSFTESSVTTTSSTQAGRG
ncbi:12585_t:CDS:2, partial [Ambispora leptoticha]